MAKQGDKFSILRSFDSLTGDHYAATYILQSGFPSASNSARRRRPTSSAIRPLAGGEPEEGIRSRLPGGSPAVYHPPPERLGGSVPRGSCGPRYEPFATGGDPNQPGFMAQGMKLANGITPQRLEGRRALLRDVDSLARKIDKDKLFQTMDSYQEKAYGLVLGDAKKGVRFVPGKRKVA